MDVADLLETFKTSTELFESLGLVTKIILTFLGLSTLAILFLVSERIFEHRSYANRKLWIGQAQRNLGRKLPPIQIVAPRINRRDEDLESVV